MIKSEATLSNDGLETGGILLGEDAFLGKAGAGPLIRHVGGPGPDAEREPRFFRRDYVYAQRLALDAFVADGSVWIGEWHTHVRGSPLPSPTDLKSYVANLTDPALGFGQFVSLVVLRRRYLVRGESPWTNLRIYAWLVTVDGLLRAHLVKAQ